MYLVIVERWSDGMIIDKAQLETPEQARQTEKDFRQLVTADYLVYTIEEKQ